ncbi:hypothetical protein [Streptomyces sp. NBC_01238]|uniref:hypothetical protein n=1 Tax=Streptomyces sp. NBC_01238 TaxID=2903791 RepID=UPI003864ACE6
MADVQDASITVDHRGAARDVSGERCAAGGFGLGVERGDERLELLPLCGVVLQVFLEEVADVGSGGRHGGTFHVADAGSDGLGGRRAVGVAARNGDGDAI